MGTIVCRHRNETLFDRLSDTYSRSLAFYWTGVDDKKQFNQVMLEPAHFCAQIEWDKKLETASLHWYQAKKRGLETPQRVVKDVHINDTLFISLCGHICNTDDYKKTNDLYDVTDVISDIRSQQPQKCQTQVLDKPVLKNKILHWNEIPSAPCFGIPAGYEYGLSYHLYPKYHREPVSSKSKNVDYYFRGTVCPFVDEGYYENINFYEDNAIWYNPNKKHIQLNHAITRENFFDKDGYLCSIWNYRYVAEEEVKQYEKIFLFLV